VKQLGTAGDLNEIDEDRRPPQENVYAIVTVAAKFGPPTVVDVVQAAKAVGLLIEGVER
jgi:hypothetical protein